MKFKRNIPVDLFHCLKRALQHSRVNKITDHITYEERSKDDIISFISKQAVVVFLSLLSGLDESDVKKYFKKYLTGRVNGKATITVNTRKKFEFIYKKKSLSCALYYIMEFGTRLDFLSTFEYGQKLWHVAQSITSLELAVPFIWVAD